MDDIAFGTYSTHAGYHRLAVSIMIALRKRGTTTFINILITVRALAHKLVWRAEGEPFLYARRTEYVSYGKGIEHNPSQHEHQWELTTGRSTGIHERVVAYTALDHLKEGTSD